MLLSKRIFDKYKFFKLSNDPDVIINYIDSIDGNYIPTSMLIDKARAIMLSNNQKYSLEDAENIFYQFQNQIMTVYKYTQNWLIFTTQ